MSFINCKIKISLNNESYSIYYSYNRDTTFQDLLEYFSFLIPSLKICQCYHFQSSKNKSDNSNQSLLISKSSKIDMFSDYLKNLSLINYQTNCIHTQNNYLLYSKKYLISSFQKNIEDFGKSIVNKNKEINDLKKYIKNYEKDMKNVVLIRQPNYKNLNFMNFYDVIVDINSIKDISKGWEIKMNPNGKQNYEKFKKEKILRVGVIGNANKGKSFLLSKISKIDLPSGMSIKTEGLSIKYPELESFKDRKIVLLDSAGLETPVLISQQILEEEKKTALFKEKSREKLITELFLQNYIVNNSDILIIVVDSLSFSEQKLLIKVKKEIERSKRSIDLFIIHNLKTYTSISQVKEYINNILLKCATFTLVPGHRIDTKNTKQEPKKGVNFSEEKKDDKGRNIYHLIYANEGSEAGEYYNQHTLDFIEMSYNFYNNLKTFDVIESIKERFIEVSEEIIEKTENNQKITKESFDNSNPYKIKLKDGKEIILKKCLIDELGFSNLKPNGFEPKYNIYKVEDKIIIKVEAPGNCDIESEIVSMNDYSIVKLSGVKKKDSVPENLEKNIYNSREFGQFFLDIPLNYKLNEEGSSIKEKKGFLILEYNLKKKPILVKYTGSE